MAQVDTTAPMPRCPRCERRDVSRSRLRWYDVPAAAVLLRPFRCSRCGHRFYQRSRTGTEMDSDR